MSLSFKEYLCLHRKFLLLNLVSRNLKLKYRKSYVGVFWTILTPAINAIIYYAVFQYVMKVNIPNYFIFILSGTVAWSFFSTTVTQGLESIVGNHALISKVPIPLNVFPLNESISLFINLLLSIPVIFISMLIVGMSFDLRLVLIPLYLLMLFFQSYALSLTVAIGYVYLRDLRHLLNIILQVLFYLNPIVYRLDMVPEQFAMAYNFIPTAYIFEGLHHSIVFQSNLPLQKFLIAVGWTVGLNLSVMFIYQRLRFQVVEKI